MPLLIHKMPAWLDVKKISNTFDQEAINIIIFVTDFSGGISLKLEKVGPTFLSFNPCRSLQFFATDDRLK